jgi:DNA polymerase II large subunit
MSASVLPFQRPVRRDDATPPMRQMVTRVCLTCDAEWQQPRLDGDCPQCGSTATTSLAVKMCNAVRAN